MVLLDLPALGFMVVPLLGAALSGRSANALATTVATVVLPVGIVGTIISVVAMFQNMSDPFTLGPAMAIALLPAIYAVIVKLGLDVYISEPPSERRAPSLILSATAVTLWMVAVVAIAWLRSVGLSSLLNFGAMGATVVSVLCIVGLTAVSGSHAFADRLATHLPSAGLVIFFAGSIGVLHALDDPSAVGPYVAIALLGLLYTISISVCLKLARPDLIAPRTSTSQWLVWGTSLASLGGSVGIVLLSISKAS